MDLETEPQRKRGVKSRVCSLQISHLESQLYPASFPQPLNLANDCEIEFCQVYTGTMRTAGKSAHVRRDVTRWVAVNHCLCSEQYRVVTLVFREDFDRATFDSVRFISVSVS